MSAHAPACVCVLCAWLLLCHGGRALLSRALAGTRLRACAMELVCTFQLCCCAHELKLLSEAGGAAHALALTLTYLAAVVHALSFRGATGNPAGTLEHAYRARISRACALRRIACQFAAAGCARAAVRVLWGLELSALHAQHKLRDFRCARPVRAHALTAAAVELACTFAVQTVLAHTHGLEEKFRVHAVAATITATVSAGGGVSGAVANPALAFSTQFFCGGGSLPQLCLVYGLGPLLGTMGSVLLLDKLNPNPNPNPNPDPNPNPNPDPNPNPNLRRTQPIPGLPLQTKKEI